jgi:hypothetical protein
VTPSTYRIPNGPPGPSPARARFSPALCGPTLSGTTEISCRAVPCHRACQGAEARHDGHFFVPCRA